MSDWNANIIDEFRGNEGKLGGHFEGRPMLLLHHTGAKTGTERVNPLTYRPVDGGYAVFASKSGAPDNPDWYYNLVANPDVKIEVGADTIAVRARVAATEERDPIWSKQEEGWSVFAEYRESASPRQIPVIVLEPRQA